jgi:geranylgeranyl reductase
MAPPPTLPPPPRCCQVRTEGGKIIRVEAHPIPEHPRPKRVQVTIARRPPPPPAPYPAARLLACTRPGLVHPVASCQLTRPLPAHCPPPAQGRVALVGDAAGYVTKCSGEGIYFAAKSGRMVAEAIVEGSANGKRMVGEKDLRAYVNK